MRQETSSHTIRHLDSERTAVTHSGNNNLALEADGLECIRDDRSLFSDLAFRLEVGQALLLEGRNGSGKTSLLRILCGIRLPDAGRVSWCGTDINRLGPDYHEHTAYVGHRDGIKQDLTPLENLAMARALGKPSGTRLEAVLEQVDLYGYEDVLTRNLSAGQQRRLALARLLVVDAPLWILDEPFTSLDVHGIGLIEGLLETHTRNGGMLAMTSHHTVNLVNTPVHQINLSS
jgi:heme exporter protein A